jgi:hypothetical protein
MASFLRIDPNGESDSSAPHVVPFISRRNPVKSPSVHVEDTGDMLRTPSLLFTQSPEDTSQEASIETANATFDGMTVSDFSSDDLIDNSWLWQFISSRGNEYFCEIDEEYLLDRFNLTGLNNEVQYYQYALDLITDVFDLDADDNLREQIEKSARHLYGLVHARYIVTTRGLAKMVSWYLALHCILGQ